jgi:hypothetical protein
MAHAYFEIVFDDSGSMNGSLAGSTRLDVAKDLFEKDILPLIDSNTEVAVRLLRRECYGSSYYQNFGCDIDECLNFIERIEAIGDCTPLFNTMKDALKSTLDNAAHHKTIFVLTDGGDNCSKTISDVLTDEELKYFKQINVILAQFTVSNGGDVNQLSHLANTIGAKTFNFASGEGASLSSIRTELKTALNVVGMNKNEPLKHCYEELPGDLVYWKDIESMGIQLHQARVLYDEHFLSWKPEYPMRVNPLQLAELKFLYGIRFKTGIGVEMMRTMLSQLVKPYYYNSNCIYWHFEEARWKYFPQPAPIVVERVVEKEVEKVVERIVEKEVIKEVPVEVIKEIYTDKVPYDMDSKEWYQKDRLYRVEDIPEEDSNSLQYNYKAQMPDMSNIFLLKKNLFEIKPKTIKVSPGDVIEFIHKKSKGRPKKNKI